MQYISYYPSPLGTILLAADEIGLTGLWFDSQKHYGWGLPPDPVRLETDILLCARHWLDIYFTGLEPDFFVPLHLQGTDFQMQVWQLLTAIPYGQTRSYGQLANALNIPSARAIGNAVGKNPISILVPCHRVLGAKGTLTGYAGGTARKAALLKLENIPVKE